MIALRQWRACSGAQRADLGLDITEPHIAAQFEGRDYAFFEAFPIDEEQVAILRRVEDQDR